MPRKPKFGHPLRSVRSAAGLSQARLAAIIGCSSVTIEKVENAKLAMSPKLAWKIERACGAKGAELMKGRRGKPLDRFGKPYTPETFRIHQKQIGDSSEQRAEKILEFMTDAVALVFRAASRPGVCKLPLVYDSLSEWLQSARDDFKLGPQIDALLKERKYTDQRTKEKVWPGWLSWGDMRSPKPVS